MNIKCCICTTIIIIKHVMVIVHVASSHNPNAWLNQLSCLRLNFGTWYTLSLGDTVSIPYDQLDVCSILFLLFVFIITVHVNCWIMLAWQFG